MSIFLLQMRGELMKLFARKRTYIGFGAFLSVELAVLVLLRLPKVQQSLERLLERAGYVAADTCRLTLGLIITLSTVFLPGPSPGPRRRDVVSKEVEEGTMRMMLARPAGRSRILSLKLAACVVYTLVLTIFIAVTAVAAGTLHAGWGGLFVYAPLEGVFAVYDASEGAARMALAVPFLATSLLTITCLGFCFSCMRMKPAAATIVTLSVLFVDTILKNITFFSGIRHWFLTAR